MSDRKQEILQTAISIIADEGYAGLSMRALARACGMKLGALQYHFRTWEELLRALVDYIAEEIGREFRSQKFSDGSPSVAEIAAFVLDDSGGSSDAQLNDRLWPQLWAMEQVEPLVSDLLEDVYAVYVQTLENAIKAAGSPAPHAEALCLMSMLEGESLFTGSGRRWEDDRKAVRSSILAYVEDRYDEKQ